VRDLAMPPRGAGLGGQPYLLNLGLGQLWCLRIAAAGCAPAEQLKGAVLDLQHVLGVIAAHIACRLQLHRLHTTKRKPAALEGEAS